MFGFRSRNVLAATLALLLVACARGPQPIAYGTDACEYCRMAISDPRFGGELVTKRGKVHKFDSVECLASFYQGARADAGSLWVSDFRHPGQFVAAEQAKYVRARGAISSPMGQGLFAFAPEADVAAEARALGGAPMTWAEVQALVRREGHGATAEHDAPSASGGIDAAR